jgi:ATP-dependent DNA helicase RecG
LPQRWLRGLIWRTLNRFESEITEPWPEIRPAERAKFGVPALADTDHERPVKLTPLRIQPPGGGTPNISFPTRANAVHMLHFPENLGDVDIARRRLALDEFIALQRDMQLRRKRFETQTTALPCSGTNRSIKPFLAQLGFRLTAAQTRVLREIRHDMAGRHPMRRLLQGDVGSGKTVVAACTALMAIESGFNVALMAPTEILAEQHFRNFKRWFETLGINVELQTGSRKTASDKWRMTSDGERLPGLPVTRHPSPATLFIGTHALIEPGFAMEKLGLVIIDEQHKFGVAQREQLVRKGRYPHVLVMTATPIPRTLGLTLYGDLDVSVIDELPPGRGRIRTFVRTADKLPKVWKFIRDKLAEGRQAFVVYPRVKDSGKGDIKAVTNEFENLKKTLVPFRIGLLHGRLGSRHKESVIQAFRGHKLDMLLATSLVEVGLDVPNATIMLVENAEQFGLAQLHQLRGRIGRGAHKSYCILVASAKTAEARQRLEVLERTVDGFQIAEADLKLRGPGELLGQQQSGLPRFRFGDLREDFELIKQARDLAAHALADV